MTLSGSSPGKGELAHPGAGCAGVDDLDAQLAGMGGLVGIGAEQRVERRLGRAIAAPEGARLLADRRGDADDLGLVGAAEQRIEGGDQRLVGEDVELEDALQLLGVEMLDRRQADRASPR